MDRYELGVALAMAEIVELRRQADRRRPGGGPGRGTTEAAMLMQHHHQPGVFDAGHFRACAYQAAHRRASVALWSFGAAILLAVVALLTG